MTSTPTFRSVYESEGAYDQLLLPHLFEGEQDVDIVARALAEAIGEQRGDLDIVEFGCGTGRVTDVLAPFARSLVLADYSAAMISAVSRRFPGVRTMHGDTRDVLASLRAEGEQFDVLGAFWSLSYPIGEFFESLTSTGIGMRSEQAVARSAALGFVNHLVSLLRPDGYLLVVHFDADTPEQRLVTRMWERIAPFPYGSRDYTLQILLEGLRAAEVAGEGRLRWTRRAGAAVAVDRASAFSWFTDVHFKGMPALVHDPEVEQEICGFVDRYTEPSGRVVLPTGMHVIEFRRSPHPHCHLPAPT